MAGLDIEDEENETLAFEGDVEEAVNKYELCLVGRFLTEKNINVNAMKSKMADVWRPAMGINIKEIEAGIFLFQFYHREDLQWVVKGGPWSFDNAMLIVQPIPDGEEPLEVSLWHLNIWIQIHDLPNALMSEGVGKQLGNFFGEFMEYDIKNNTSIWREYMRVKIRLDVRKPLKRKKKITRRAGTEVIVSCKYERLGEFCFSCGLISHTDRFCRRFMDKRLEEGSKEWGNWLRAPPRRVAGPVRSKWLRDEGDMEWEAKIGRANSIPENVGGSDTVPTGEIIKGRNNRNFDNKIISTAGVGVSKFQNLESAGKTKQLGFGIGPEEEELSGLILEERKRKRIGPVILDRQMVEDGVSTSQNIINGTDMDVVLSEKDCTTSPGYDLAKLARQASQLQ